MPYNYTVSEIGFLKGKIDMTTVLRCLWIAALAAAIPLYSFTAYANEKYLIVLENGRSIEVSSYWEEGDLLCYHKYGAKIGILKSTVASISSVSDNSENIETVTLDKSFKRNAKRIEQQKKRTSTLKSALSDCEKKLKQAEQNVRFYCGKSESFARNPGQLSVSAGSIRQIHNTSRTCSYYKNRLEKYQKECK